MESTADSPVPSLAECWDKLPYDLQGRILDKLDDEQRCSIIPCVSREFLRLHTTYPPQRKHWIIRHPVRQGILTWFRSIASSLETLTFHTLCKEANLLDIMLAEATVASPQLRRLSFDRSATLGTDVFKDLVALCQLTKLQLGKWLLHGDTELPELHRISALQSLQELEVAFMMPDSTIQASHTTVLSAISSLNSLRTLEVAIGAACVSGVVACLHAMSLLTQISHLKITTVHMVEDGMEGNTSQASLSMLTQLTALTINTSAQFAYLVLQTRMLPRLKQLLLIFQEDEIWGQHQPASASFTAYQLTRVHLRAIGRGLPKEHLATVPATLLCSPTLKYLRSLQLEDLGLQSFPAPVASALKSLTQLSLARNCFTRLPSTLSRIRSLQCLDMKGNLQLNLHKSDVDWLTAMPGLHTLLLPISFRSRIVNAEMDSFSFLQLVAE